jgi:hypothetical protein
MDSIYNRLKLVSEGDTLFITNATNTYTKCQKVTLTNRHYIYTKDFQFSKTTGKGVPSTRHKTEGEIGHLLQIDDIVKNPFKQLVEEFKKDFILDYSRIDVAVFYVRTKRAEIEVKLYRGSKFVKERCTTLIKANGVPVFAGDLGGKEDYLAIKRICLEKYFNELL